MASLDRAAILAEADSILRRDNFSHQDKARVDSLISLADSIGGHSLMLKRAKMAQSDRELGLRTSGTSHAPEVEADFRAYLAGTHPSLLSEIGQKSIVDFRADTPRDLTGVSAEIPAEIRRQLFPADGPIVEGRAEGIGTGSAGAYLAPQSFVDVLESNLVSYDGIFDAGTRFATRSGTAFTHPLLDDPTQEAIIVAENQEGVAGNDFTFTGGVSWPSVPTFRSGPILVSRELAQDSYFPLAAELGKAFGQRLARGAGRVVPA